MDNVYRLSDSDDDGKLSSDEEHTTQERLVKGQRRSRTQQSRDSDSDTDSDSGSDSEEEEQAVATSSDASDEFFDAKEDQSVLLDEESLELLSLEQSDEQEAADASSLPSKKRKHTQVVEGLSAESLQEYRDAHERSGLIYMSRVPPYMKPQKVRHLLESYGEIGRIYLAPEDDHARKRRIKLGGNRKAKFTEGWIEFKDKRVAKNVARILNTQPIGGKKRGFYQHDLWTLKYLPKFKWNHLTERIAYEKAARQQRMQTELEQARRENKHYLQNVERAQLIETIQDRRRQRGRPTQKDGTNDEKVRRTFTQKPVVASEVSQKRAKKARTARKSSGDDATTVDASVRSVLSKLF